MSVTGPGGPGVVGAGALITEIEEAFAPTPPPRRRTRSSRFPPLWRVIILVLAVIFFLGPLIASFKYSLLQDNGNYGFHNYLDIVTSAPLRDSLFKSLEISALTAVVDVVLMVPTVVFVRLRLPKLSLFLEGVTILPIVVPPIVIAAGLAALQSSAPTWLIRIWLNHPLTGLAPVYVMRAMPFTYRALDTGVRAIDLRTLVDASRSLGANWGATLARVILPNIESALLGAIFLTVALCLGEVVLSTILLYNTFPVEMINVSQTSPGIAVAISLCSIIFVFLLLFLLSFLVGRRGNRSVRVI